MARSTKLRLPTWVTPVAVTALLFAFRPADATGQVPVSCDADLLGTLRLPEIRTSAARAPLRVAPAGDAKVVITLPSDIKVPLLDQSDGWFAVSYRDRDRNRRLYVSAEDVYVEDDEHYGTGFAVWSGISVVSRTRLALVATWRP